MSASRSRLEKVIIAECTSTSGKWKLFFCEHIRAGNFCYDVVALDTTTSELITRHYCDTRYPTEASKAEALRVYNDYKEKLQQPAKHEEKDEPKRRFRLVLPDGGELEFGEGDSGEGGESGPGGRPN